ncbi:MAG: histidine decarboxylase, partial [Campylobacterales bacterium]|nr:histidine decarboxylase [Campylobacterales bacterium]
QKMANSKKEEALSKLHDYEFTQKENFLGYQVNQDIDYKTNYSNYLNISLNNVGDPFTDGNLTTQTKMVEREVLKYFAKLWNNPNRDDKYPKKDDYWGYVVSMGCTEANIFGLLSGRDYLEGKYLLIDKEKDTKAKKISQCSQDFEFLVHQTKDQNPNSLIPIAFYSQDTHYSNIKAMEILKINTFNKEASLKGYSSPLEQSDFPKGFSQEYLDKNGWPLEVPSNQDGSVHIPALIKLIDFFAQKGHPILVCFNYGSTFKGAYDDVQSAVEQIVPILKKYGLYEREIEYDSGMSDLRDGFWFHVDGALGAAYMPYIEQAIEQKKIKKPYEAYRFPIFDFRLPQIHSVSMSGHKWIGSPWPTGIYMSKVKYQLKPVDDPMYIGSPDTTFAGSPNGFSPLILWEYLSNHSLNDHIDKVVSVENRVQKTYEKLKSMDRDGSLWVQRSPFSLTIRMKKPNDEIVFKYSLSTEELYVNSQKRKYAHIFVMEHVTDSLIDAFVNDLEQSGYFKGN